MLTTKRAKLQYLGVEKEKFFLLSPNQTTNGDTLHQQEEYMVMLPTA
jgi:hypothetical protein